MANARSPFDAPLTPSRRTSWISFDGSDGSSSACPTENESRPPRRRSNSSKPHVGHGPLRPCTNARGRSISRGSNGRATLPTGRPWARADGWWTTGRTGSACAVRSGAMSDGGRKDSMNEQQTPQRALRSRPVCVPSLVDGPARAAPVFRRAPVPDPPASPSIARRTVRPRRQGRWVSTALPRGASRPGSRSDRLVQGAFSVTTRRSSAEHANNADRPVVFPILAPAAELPISPSLNVP